MVKWGAHLNSPSLCLLPPLIAVVLKLEMWHARLLSFSSANINDDTIGQGLFLYLSILVLIVFWSNRPIISGLSQ